MSHHKLLERDGVLVVTVKGDLMGGKDTEACHQQVKAELEKGNKKVVADLSHLKWINSQGLGMLIACYTSCANAGGEFKIAGATEKIRSLLMMTKLLEFFEDHDTVDEAIARF